MGDHYPGPAYDPAHVSAGWTTESQLADIEARHASPSTQARAEVDEMLRELDREIGTFAEALRPVQAMADADIAFPSRQREPRPSVVSPNTTWLYECSGKIEYAVNMLRSLRAQLDV